MNCKIQDMPLVGNMVCTYISGDPVAYDSNLWDGTLLIYFIKNNISDHGALNEMRSIATTEGRSDSRIALIVSPSTLPLPLIFLCTWG